MHRSCSSLDQVVKRQLTSIRFPTKNDISDYINTYIEYVYQM